MNFLYLIPARGGSRGLPGKNIKLLNGKPLIYYSIEVAKKVTDRAHICVSTDSREISGVVERYPLEVPFLRPAELATDQAGTAEVILHALDFYQNRGISYQAVVLLQPTSPFRLEKHLREAVALFDPQIDMVVSVKEAKANPYFNLFEEDAQGYLHKSKPGAFTRRQDVPTVYEFNGSVYVINAEALRREGSLNFSKVRKYIMEEKYSPDIDTAQDWEYVEYLCNTGKIAI